MNSVLQHSITSNTKEARLLPSDRSCDLLYVEDDAPLRCLSANVLLESGYDVDVAEDGEAGWEALSRCRYDLLITDNEMPRLTGVELVKRLRFEGRAVPVVMASGAFDSDVIERYRWLHVAAILRKPFTPEQLLNVVKVVLRAVHAVRKHGNPQFSVLDEALAEIEPVRRWGLNE